MYFALFVDFIIFDRAFNERSTQTNIHEIYALILDHPQPVISEQLGKVYNPWHHLKTTTLCKT